MSEVKLELWKNAPFTVQQVLEWASENVVSVDKQAHFPSWCAYLGPKHEFFYPGPTLYDALYEAWKSRDTTKDL